MFRNWLKTTEAIVPNEADMSTTLISSKWMPWPVQTLNHWKPMPFQNLWEILCSRTYFNVPESPPWPKAVLMNATVSGKPTDTTKAATFRRFAICAKPHHSPSQLKEIFTKSRADNTWRRKIDERGGLVDNVTIVKPCSSLFLINQSTFVQHSPTQDFRLAPNLTKLQTNIEKRRCCRNDASVTNLVWGPKRLGWGFENKKRDVWTA